MNAMLRRIAARCDGVLANDTLDLASALRVAGERYGGRFVPTELFF
jgi:hypothetical protein